VLLSGLISLGKGERVHMVMNDVRLPEGRTLRVIVPGGTVEISTGLETEEGDALVTVDVIPDTPRFGPDTHGRSWRVLKSAVDGIVRMVGKVEK
jgi:hypothetical protein